MVSVIVTVNPCWLYAYLCIALYFAGVVAAAKILL